MHTETVPRESDYPRFTHAFDGLDQPQPLVGKSL
jgi:hypothetical protein